MKWQKATFFVIDQGNPEEKNKKLIKQNEMNSKQINIQNKAKRKMDDRKSRRMQAFSSIDSNRW
ncbi:MAG: hypothetical protein LKF83_02785 [Solobacterium sp.]|jgi:hypothetical protein|nr:hypothetical protein [Solobacterium sp.]